MASSVLRTVRTSSIPQFSLSLANIYNLCCHHADWDPAVFNEEKELIQGKTLVDAAEAADVKHFVLDLASSDEEAVERIVEQARVVINTIGPYYPTSLPIARYVSVTL